MRFDRQGQSGKQGEVNEVKRMLGNVLFAYVTSKRRADKTSSTGKPESLPARRYTFGQPLFHLFPFAYSCLACNILPVPD